MPALGLLLRWLPGHTGGGDRWSWRVDGLALMIAFLGGVMLHAWLVRFHLPDGQVTTSDFHEYCSSVAALVQGDLGGWTPQRSRLPGSFVALLAGRLGILDGLLVAATLSAGFTSVGLYLWGRAAHGRLAGLSAVVAGGAVAELVMLSRNLSLYPETTAAFTLAAGTSVVALRWRHPLACAAAGLGVGLCLLVDLRGLIWALPLGGLGLLACVLPPWRPGWRVPLRLGAFLLPLALSWAAAGLAYTERSISLEQQVGVDSRLRELGVEPLQNPVRESRYVFGHTPLSDLPDTVLHLAEERRRIPPAEVLEPYVVGGRELRVEPWLGLGLAACLLAAFGLRRRPLLLLGVAGSLLPFAVSLRSSILLLPGLVRYLGQAAPLLALVLGLAWATLVQGPLPARDLPAARLPWKRRLWLGLAGLLPLLLVLGVIPGPLSPLAAWRTPALSSAPDGYLALRCRLRLALGLESRCKGGNPGQVQRCDSALRADHAAGLTRFSEGLWERAEAEGEDGPR